uniref:Peroxisomal N(1)-acetyl-spermine/spermidine oxidase-like n=1 Tax=Callorhinchus milii TaxID=7868 RepID=A0A4W3JN23_CALMI
MLILVLFLHVSYFSTSGQKSPKIVIVGAGLAGVGAANKLVKQGFTDVQIIEAFSQPGGRIKGSLFGKLVVDEGPQFIHGASMDNPIFQLAKEHGLLEAFMPIDNIVVYSSTQEQLNPEFASQMWELGSNITYRAHLLAKEKGYEMVKSLLDAYVSEVSKLKAAWSNDPVDLINQKLGMLNMVLKSLSVDYAVHSLADVSVHSNEEQYMEGGDCNSLGLYLKLIAKLLEPIPQERLLLGKPVKQIMWNGNFQSEDGTGYPVRVQCEDGDQILADHVIVTVSLGCLKENAQSLFHPNLPEKKLHAIQSIGFGTTNKIYFEYEEPFWPENISEIGLHWQDESPLIALKSNIAEWWRCLCLFNLLQPAERYGNVLVAWVSGREAKFVETLSAEELGSTITMLLRNFTGRPSLPEPKRVLVTKWFTNPYTRGSYSYMSVNSSSAMVDTLAEPLPQGGSENSTQALQVLFAGEATHRSFHSTTHGALLSGWREAERLIHQYATAEEEFS